MYMQMDVHADGCTCMHIDIDKVRLLLFIAVYVVTMSVKEGYTYLNKFPAI